MPDTPEALAVFQVVPAVVGTPSHFVMVAGPYAGPHAVTKSRAALASAEEHAPDATHFRAVARFVANVPALSLGVPGWVVGGPDLDLDPMTFKTTDGYTLHRTSGGDWTDGDLVFASSAAGLPIDSDGAELAGEVVA